MKYRELITIFMTLVFILSLAYVIGVNSSLWFIPAILFFYYFSLFTNSE